MLALIGVALLMNTMSGGLVLTMLPFLLPIPFMLYTREYGITLGFAVLFSALILGILLTPIEYALITVMYGLIGVVYGEGLKRDLNDKQLFFITFSLTLIIYFITTILFGALFGYNVLSEIDEVTKITMGAMPGNPQLSVSRIRDVAFMVVLLMYVFQAVLEAYVIGTLSHIISLYLKKPTPRKVKLIDLEYPPLLGVLSAFFFLSMLYVNKHPEYESIKLITGFLGITGYAYLTYLGLLFFRKDKRFSKWRLYSIIIFIFTMAIYSPIHMGIGLFSSLSNTWRKPHE